MRIFQKIIAFLCALALLLCAIPTVVLADELNPCFPLTKGETPAAESGNAQTNVSMVVYTFTPPTHILANTSVDII